MVHIEYRKLIKFGNSSYIISVPNLWLKKNNLRKGDVVCVEEDGDSRLILTSTGGSKKEERGALININNKSEERIKEEVYRVYTDGADFIKLSGENLNDVNEGIRKTMNNLLAVEIVEQTNNTMVAKNFLNVEDVKIKDVIRRIDTILRSMFTDSVECLDKKNSESIALRDGDVNRLCYMLLRVLKIGMRDPEVSKKIGVSGTELLHVWFIVTNLETIGDEVKRISRFLNGVKFTKKQKEELRILYSDIEKAYLDVMKAYYKNDKELAFDVVFRREELHERCNDFFGKNNIPMVGGMVEKMKALVSWIKSIAMVAYED
ncbi:MAG: phosphate uptake regulator PhoU [Nanoarchaeota archaeon]|nr:phosphate uptake regulator PhoU [Nanoarchaeota archaeon]